MKFKYAIPIVAMAFVEASMAVEFEDYDYSRWSQTVTECDQLAAHSLDPGHVGPGVTSKTMDKEAAIIACHDAVKADPENPRLNYQLGRAYGYSDRGEEAMPYRLKAVEADYPQSTFVIGYLYFVGRTIDQNTCRALSLWQISARNRRLAALISLPRHYLRGDFDECGVEIRDADLREYVEEAGRTSSDYYVSLLVEDMLAELDARSE